MRGMMAGFYELAQIRSQTLFWMFLIWSEFTSNSANFMGMAGVVGSGGGKMETTVLEKKNVINK